MQHTCFSLSVDHALKPILLYTTCMDGQEYVFNLFLKEYKMPRSYSPQATKSRYKSLHFIIYDLLCFIGKDSGVVILALSTIWNSVMYSTLVLKYENIKVWNLMSMCYKFSWWELLIWNRFYFLNNSLLHFNGILLSASFNKQFFKVTFTASLSLLFSLMKYQSVNT